MIVGISMVRNEVDIIETCVRHHFENEGFDKILIVDDNSTDGTFEALQKLDDNRLIVERQSGRFLQSDIVSRLAEHAFALGAKWIVPFDADEFWHAPGGLSQFLQSCDTDESLKIEVINFVQNFSVNNANLKSNQRAKFRARAIGEYWKGADLVASGACSYIESAYPPKFIHRAFDGMKITAGNHHPSKESFSAVDEVKCYHIPLRAKSVFATKVDHSQRLNEANFPAFHGWHIRHFEKMARDGKLDNEWLANSERDGHLETMRGRIPLVYDPSLSFLIAAVSKRRQFPFVRFATRCKRWLWRHRASDSSNQIYDGQVL